MPYTTELTPVNLSVLEEPAVPPYGALRPGAGDFLCCCHCVWLVVVLGVAAGLQGRMLICTVGPAQTRTTPQGTSITWSMETAGRGMPWQP